MSKFTEYLEAVKVKSKSFSSYKQMVSDIKQVLNKKYKVANYDRINMNIIITPSFDKKADETCVSYKDGINNKFNLTHFKAVKEDHGRNGESNIIDVGHQIGKMISFEKYQELLDYLKTVK